MTPHVVHVKFCTVVVIVFQEKSLKSWKTEMTKAGALDAKMVVLGCTLITTLNC